LPFGRHVRPYFFAFPRNARERTLRSAPQPLSLVLLLLPPLARAAKRPRIGIIDTSCPNGTKNVNFNIASSSPMRDAVDRGFTISKPVK